MPIKWQFHVWTNTVCPIEGISLIAVEAAEAKGQAELLEGFGCISPISPLERVCPCLQFANPLSNLLQCCSPQHWNCFEDTALQENAGEELHLSCEPRDSPCYSILSLRFLKPHYWTVRAVAYPTFHSYAINFLSPVPYPHHFTQPLMPFCPFSW